MGFIREPEGIDFVIAPSQSAEDNIAFISNYIRQHKENCRGLENKAKLKRQVS